MFRTFISLWFLLLIGTTPQAFSAQTNAIEELDPFSPDIEEQLLELDQIYEEETGKSPFIGEDEQASGCYRSSCKIWVVINKTEQDLTLYIDGYYSGRWDVSTGLRSHETPDFDRHPNGRIYDRYTSTKYPNGDYRGLGNMPYAIFIQGGFAMHGTPEASWWRLGTRASHGCIRMHPDNAQRVNLLVRKYGIYRTWVTVRD